ncbi:hypothetical protein [Serratia proteamaculans]|uniref:hypothetical protein n=1 Tax=Serratia proteamaculans TaxID=28151 RepID=UPI003D0835B8
MSILNFREIAPPIKPTKKDYGGQLDDFEKFAQEFFREVYDAEFIEVAARGADGGRDLLFNVLVNGTKQKWAVSCKHTAHSGNAVGEMETNISDRFARSGADVFVGFYSHIPSSALQQTFLDLERHNPKFKSKIYNSAQIETELLSAQNSKGWFLAARFFPLSFVRLFRRFLQPIAHYQAENVVDNGKGGLELAYPGGALTSYRDEKDKQSRITSLVKEANDTVTFALHEAFFAELLMEIIKQWPTCFAYWGATPIDQLSTSDILPTFEVQDVIELFQKHSSATALVVCHFWTWWDEKRAVTTYQQAYNQALNSNISEEQARINLGIRIALQCCPIELRDQITRLVAFAPSDLKELNLWRKIARTVQRGTGENPVPEQRH